MTERYLAQGLDGEGVPRVWAYGWTELRARDAAWLEAWEYFKHHPDTGPFVDWEVVVERSE